MNKETKRMRGEVNEGGLKFWGYYRIKTPNGMSAPRERWVDDPSFEKLMEKAVEASLKLKEYKQSEEYKAKHITYQKEYAKRKETEVKAYRVKYYEKNKDKIKDTARTWATANRSLIRERRRKEVEDPMKKQARAAYQLAWRLANAERKQAKQEEYRKKNSRLLSDKQIARYQKDIETHRRKSRAPRRMAGRLWVFC